MNMQEAVKTVYQFRQKMLADPYRPGYHFAIPEDDGMPGDSNGAFFADGRYHLMYLYRSTVTNAFHWGHISSLDLLHWRHHPDALTNYEGDEGCFSGGAFVDDDGTAYFTFWKFPSVNGKDRGGIAMACARPPYDVWERMEPIAVESGSIWGVTEIETPEGTKYVGSADPSNIWKANGYYYMQTGNKCVLDTYGRKPEDPDCYKGDWVDLFRSKDLKKWEYVHRFYENKHLGADWPDETEDDMCPSFLPLPDKKSGGKLTDKWLQLFISHNKGCQYYVGALEGETFIPEQHGRMSWKDRDYFAPEALIDDKNRQLAWVWLVDNLRGGIAEDGWSGVYCFPRAMWFENNELHMAPAEELDRLQYNHQHFDSPEGLIPVKNGESFRLKAEITPCCCTEKLGFAVRESSDGAETTEIYVDLKNKKLVMDTTRSGLGEWCCKEEAPFELKAGEKISLDIFVDKAIVEVYVNERQAICRRVYPSNPKDAVGVRALQGTKAVVDAWEMMPTSAY